MTCRFVLAAVVELFAGALPASAADGTPAEEAAHLKVTAEMSHGYGAPVIHREDVMVDEALRSRQSYRLGSGTTRSGAGHRGEGWCPALVLVALVFLKIVAFAFTVSSGGSGGVSARTLFVGAMLGGLLSSLAHLPAAMFVVLGMMTTFGAAARVPIASLLMVTEMTGGYRLLPPAAFAVLLGYLVQTQLSAKLKYKNLYEAQVPGRAQLPARYVENVQLALGLLGSRKIPQAARVGHLHLVALLDSGLPIRMPGQKELSVGVLRPQSALIGKPIQSCYEAAAGAALEIIAILARR